MHEPLRITTLTPEDWPRFRSIRLLALQDAPDAFAETLVEAQARREAEWSALLARLSGRAGACLLAHTANTDLGIAIGEAWEGRPDSAGLFALWVAPEGRRQGVARMLIRKVADWARLHRFTDLLLEVGAANAGAIALYSESEFLPTGARKSLPPPRAHIVELEMRLAL
ncbi:MAG: GNAT family N-acetyltransferase [Pseudomonadota bacterium]